MAQARIDCVIVAEGSAACVTHGVGGVVRHVRAIAHDRRLEGPLGSLSGSGFFAPIRPGPISGVWIARARLEYEQLKTFPAPDTRQARVRSLW